MLVFQLAYIHTCIHTYIHILTHTLLQSNLNTFTHINIYRYLLLGPEIIPSAQGTFLYDAYGQHVDSFAPEVAVRVLVVKKKKTCTVFDRILQ